MMKKTLLIILLITLSLETFGQFTYGTTGLLNMPTAEMQQDKTFMFGGSFLEKHTTPPHWSYDTFNYYINITFFPFLEVGYICTLHKALYGSKYYPKFVWGKFSNQDRNFAVRLRVWKEGWWKSWTPQIVFGANDFASDSWHGGSIAAASEMEGNGFYNRYYLAVTKRFKWYGEWGAHLAYLYNRRKDYHFNGPALGINFHPTFHTPLNFMAEYDSKSINIGVGYSIWKDHINIVGELSQCKYPSLGVYFKVHL